MRSCCSCVFFPCMSSLRFVMTDNAAEGGPFARNKKPRRSGAQCRHQYAGLLLHAGYFCAPAGGCGAGVCVGTLVVMGARSFCAVVVLLVGPVPNSSKPPTSTIAPMSTGRPQPEKRSSLSRERSYWL